MTEAAADPSVPPPCPTDGIAMRPSKRTMLKHDISSGQAVPVEQTFDVWRCPKCGRELPRQSWSGRGAGAPVSAASSSPDSSRSTAPMSSRA